MTRPRKRRVRKKFLYFILAAASVFAVLGSAGYLAVYSDLLKVETININGNVISNSEEIRSKLAADLASRSLLNRFLGERSLLFWPNGKFKPSGRLLPAVLEMNFEKNWGSKTVTIEVTERKPFGIFCETLCYWFDEEGVLFDRSPEATGFLIAKVKDENRRNLGLNDQIIGKPEFTDNLIQTIKILSAGSILKPKTYVIKNIGLQEFHVLTDGPELYFSLGFIPKDLTKILEAIAKETNIRRLNYIDFRVENRVYYK